MNATCPTLRFARRLRRGIAPLELVMALPILLLLMALIINYGTAWSWKVRADVAARHAGWSSRSGRSPGILPRPQGWPLAANLGYGGGADAPNLDDPRVDQPVARGPTLPLGTVVNRDLLDPGLGMHTGSASQRRPYTLLQSMPWYTAASRVEMLDNVRNFWQTGQPSNSWRRIPALYALARAPAALSGQYVRAVLAILRAPFKRDLDPLDRDDEFIGYARRFGWGGGAPDFHPQLPGCNCGNCLDYVLDAAKMDDRVQRLVDDIQGRKPPPQPRIPSVAERMAGGFVGLYRRVQNELRMQLQTVPPPPLAVQAQIKAEIAQLQAKIDLLQQYIATQP